MPKPPIKSQSMAYAHVLEEVNQAHSIRKPLYQELEKHLNGEKKVVSFFTSFRWPVIIDDGDADMLEELLQNCDLDGKELVLLLNSPGGEALAAERIVNICRSFGNGKFSVIIPKMAKSAATMICFGASELQMSKTSEMGPIDPQIPEEDDRGNVIRYRAAHEVLESYNELMKRANTTRGNQEPYLQQLARFDARDIRRIVYAKALSESIAVKVLQSGVLAGRTYKQVRNKITPFVDPKYTKTHGRPMYHDVATKCGLKVKIPDLKGDLWQTVWKLYIRLSWVVSSTPDASKIIESEDNSYTAPIPAFLLSESHNNAGEQK